MVVMTSQLGAPASRRCSQDMNPACIIQARSGLRRRLDALDCLPFLEERADQRQLAGPDRARAVAAAEVLKALVADIAVFGGAKVFALKAIAALAQVWHVILLCNVGN